MLETVGMIAQFGERLSGILEKVGFTVIILILGWIVALAARKTVGKLLRFVAFDVAAEKAGVGTFLQRGGIMMAPSALMGALAYWVVLILVIVSAVDYLGLTVVAESLDKLVAYIPNVIGSVLILVIGLFLAGVSAGVVRTAASNAGITHASLVGLVAQAAIVAFAVVMALEKLGFAATIVATSFNILFGAICFGLALAFGLGCKDLAREWVEGLVRGDKEKQ